MIKKLKIDQKKKIFSFLQEMTLVRFMESCMWSMWMLNPFRWWFCFLPPSQVQHPPLLAPSPSWQPYTSVWLLFHTGSLSCRHHLHSHMSLTQKTKVQQSDCRREYHTIWGFSKHMPCWEFLGTRLLWSYFWDNCHLWDIIDWMLEFVCDSIQLKAPQFCSSDRCQQRISKESINKNTKVKQRFTCLP